MVNNLAASGQGFDPWSGKIPYAVEQLRLLPQLLSLCTVTTEPTCPEPVLHKRSHCNEEPVYHNEE